MMSKFKNPFKESKKNELLFLGLEFIGAVAFSLITVVMFKVSDTLFSGFLLPLVVKVFCAYETISIWETFIKNTKVEKEEEPPHPQDDKVSPTENVVIADEENIVPRVPDFEE